MGIYEIIIGSSRDNYATFSLFAAANSFSEAIKTAVDGYNQEHTPYIMDNEIKGVNCIANQFYTHPGYYEKFQSVNDLLVSLTAC